MVQLRNNIVNFALTVIKISCLFLNSWTLNSRRWMGQGQVSHYHLIFFVGGKMFDSSKIRFVEKEMLTKRSLQIQNM